MIWLICYLLVGSSYRAELALRYHSDVCATGAVENLSLSARNFDTGICDCFHGERVLRRNCYACWCAPVLLATDAAGIGFMGFWLALVLTSIFLPLIWLFGFIERLRMRSTFNMDQHLCTDFLVWIFLVPCALVQEHKFMERVYDLKKRGRTGVTIEPLGPVAEPVTST